MYKSLLRQRLQNLKRILPQFLKYFYKIKMYYDLIDYLNSYILFTKYKDNFSHSSFCEYVTVTHKDCMIKQEY